MGAANDTLELKATEVPLCGFLHLSGDTALAHGVHKALCPVSEGASRVALRNGQQEDEA